MIAPAAAVKSFATSNIDIASERLAAIYGPDARVEHHGDRKGFAMRFQAVIMGSATLAKAEIANWSLSRITGALVNVTVPLSGSLRYGCGARYFTLDEARDAGVGRAHDAINMKVARGLGLSFYAPLPKLIERAQYITGRADGAALSSGMVDRVDLRTPAGAALARNMRAAMHELASLRSIELGGFAAADFEPLLLDLATTCLFPEVLRRVGEPQPDCGPLLVRRAREHIEDNAAGPIDLSKLASDLGVGIRTLQVNFRRQLGVSPRDYIMQCRLRDARRRLSNPRLSISVTDVAFAAGFTDLGQFGAKYKAKFGELPSMTLRRAKNG